MKRIPLFLLVFLFIGLNIVNASAKGNEIISYYKAGDHVYRSWYNKTTANVKIHEIGKDGLPMKLVQDYQWTAGWTEVEYYYAGHMTTIFCYNKNTGASVSHRMNLNGTVGQHLRTEPFEAGFEIVEPYRIGTETFLCLYNPSNGRAILRKVNTDGTMGPDTDVFNASWPGTGWTEIEFMKISNQTFGFFYRAGNGKTTIHKMNPNGSIGQWTYSDRWIPGWSDIEFFWADGKTLMQCYNQGGKSTCYRFQEQVGRWSRTPVSDQQWRKRMTSIEFFRAGGHTYILTYQPENSYLYTVRMTDEGVLGQYMREGVVNEKNVVIPRNPTPVPENEKGNAVDDIMAYWENIEDQHKGTYDQIRHTYRGSWGAWWDSAPAHVQGVAKVKDNWILSHNTKKSRNEALFIINNLEPDDRFHSVGKGHHPGGIQACGDIVIVSAKDEYKTYFVDCSDPIKPKTLPVTIDTNYGDAVGLVYHPLYNCHYALVQKKLWKSNLPLSDPACNFEMVYNLDKKGFSDITSAKSGGTQLFYNEKDQSIYVIDMQRIDNYEALRLFRIKCSQDVNTNAITYTPEYISWRRLGTRIGQDSYGPGFRWGAAVRFDNNKMDIIGTSRSAFLGVEPRGSASSCKIIRWSISK